MKKRAKKKSSRHEPQKKRLTARAVSALSQEHERLVAAIAAK